jgi:DNA or RNA helicases of superfamily II
MNLHKSLTAYLIQSGIALRPLQELALESTLISKQGQVFLPTGVGKTIVEVLTTLDVLLRKQDKGETGVAVFASHRLLLCEQLLGQLIKYAHGIGIPFDVLTVASDGINEEDVADLREGLGDLLKFCTVKMTTTIEEAATFVEESGKRKRHTLIVATYQSFDRLRDIPKIDIACMDEAHTVVDEDKFENVQMVLNKGIIDRVFYFTATPVHGCNGRGMDNSQVFGPVLISVTPRQAIDQGDILPPVIHKVNIQGGHSLSAIVKGAYLEHRNRIQMISGDKRVAQLLVSVEGIDEMIALVTNKNFQEWAIGMGICTMAFSSAKGYFNSGCEVNRKKAIETIREISKKEMPLILLHYDILTEGIDLPNLTGVLPLRELNTVKFLQTCGRAARLTVPDRGLLKQGIKSSVGPDGVVQLNPVMEKPCYWVIDPQESKAYSEDIVKRIREEYELEPAIRDFVEKSTSKNSVEAEPLNKPLTMIENEAKTFLTHEFEIYRLMALTDPNLPKEEQEKGINQILKVLDKELDILNVEGEPDGKDEKLGSDTPEAPVLETDWVGAPESSGVHKLAKRGGLTKLLGY